MAKFDNGDFVKVSGSERVYIVDKLLHTQKQTIPVAADREKRIARYEAEYEAYRNEQKRLQGEQLDIFGEVA